MFGFPVKVSWPNIASLPRNMSSSSQQIPSEVSDFPIPIALSRHWGRDAPHAPPLFTCLIILITRKKLSTIKMKRKQNKLNYVRDKRNGRLKWSIKFLHAFNFALKAENDVLVFLSHVRLFQMHTPL